SPSSLSTSPRPPSSTLFPYTTLFRSGDDASVLVGDHLYSKSFAMLVQDNDRGVMETLARATVSMTEAEVFQLERKRDGVTTEARSEEHTSELQSRGHLVCRLLLEKKK